MLCADRPHTETHAQNITILYESHGCVIVPTNLAGKIQYEDISIFIHFWPKVVLVFSHMTERFFRFDYGSMVYFNNLGLLTIREHG